MRDGSALQTPLVFLPYFAFFAVINRFQCVLIGRRVLRVGKMEELTKENAKILQKIVEARQINVKARHKLVNTIKRDEDRSRSVRDALARASVRRQSEIAMDNQRIAVKLFTQKPTYELLKFEKAHKQHKERVHRVSKMAK